MFFKLDLILPFPRPPTSSVPFPSFRPGAGGPWLAGPAGVAPQPPPFPAQPNMQPNMQPPPNSFNPITSQPDFGTQTFGAPLGNAAAAFLPPVSMNPTNRNLKRRWKFD